MPKTHRNISRTTIELPKCPSGIRGLDEITEGGFPKAGATLVCGAAGTGKTLLAMEFLARGASRYGEPGVFVAFEESAKGLMRNLASLNLGIAQLVARKKLFIEEVKIDKGDIQQTGQFTLDGLFIRLECAMRAVGAKRVALDTVDVLLGSVSDTTLLRSELRRLLRWLNDRGMTVVVTAEQGTGSFTRHGVEDYVADCVVALDLSMSDQVATRHIRIPKYRGSRHGTNQYPFLIDNEGLLVVPITSLGLRHDAPTARVSSGIVQLDAMLDGKGYFRGSTAMVSGTAGTGKSSMAAHFIDAACARGERALYFAFEESERQVERNMRSIGLDLARWTRKGLLRFDCSRPSATGLEGHLAEIFQQIEGFKPQVVVMDPISDFEAIGRPFEVKAMLAKLVDYLKGKNITAFLTSLTASGAPSEQSEVGVSSLIDTWILLRNLELAGERTRTIYILKSRGTAHSNRVREFQLTDRGVNLVDVYVGPDGMLTGFGREAQQAHDRDAARELSDQAKRETRAIQFRRQALEARIAAMRAEFSAEAQTAAQARKGEASLSRSEGQRRVVLASERPLAPKAAETSARRHP